MKLLIHIVIVFLVTIPLAILMTVVTSGFWNWFEGVTGIESYGHFGPAGWCYLADYLIISVIGLIVVVKSDRNTKRFDRHD